MKNYKTIQEVRDCEELNAIEKVQIEYYESTHYCSDALEKYGRVEVFEGSAIEYATDLFNECYDFSDNVEPFIDYKAFCNYLIIRGDIYQFNDKYLITNANYINRTVLTSTD